MKTGCLQAMIPSLLILFVLGAFAVDDPLYGSNANRPGVSCDDILKRRGNAGTPEGLYYIDVLDSVIPVYCRQGWTMIHKLSSTVPGIPSEIWLDGNSVNEFNTAIINRGKNAHYRNRIVANWDLVDKVLVELVVNQTTVKTMSFGRGTNNLNWFSSLYVNNSSRSTSWEDLPVGGVWENDGRFFQLDTNPSRNWYINNNFNGCDQDSGWQVIAGATDACTEWPKTPFISISYSPFSNRTKWIDSQFADTFVVSVKLKDSECPPFPYATATSGVCTFCAGLLTGVEFEASSVSIDSQCFANNASFAAQVECKFGNIITSGNYSNSQVSCPVPPLVAGSYSFSISSDGGFTWSPSCSRYIASPLNNSITTVTYVYINSSLTIHLESGSSVDIFLFGLVDPLLHPSSWRPNPSSTAIETSLLLSLGTLSVGNSLGNFTWTPSSLPTARVYVFKIVNQQSGRSWWSKLYAIPQTQCYGKYCGIAPVCGQSSGNAIDAVDEACLAQDLCYGHYGYLNEKCDWDFVDKLKKALPACGDSGCINYGLKAIDTTTALRHTIPSTNVTFIPGQGPVGRAGGWGDPHYTTMDDCYYTFNGQGEFILLQIGSGNSTQFVAQVRTDKVQIFPATMASALALQASLFGSRVGLYAKGLDADVFVDGFPISLAVGCSYDFSGGKISKTGVGAFAVDFDNGISVRADTERFLADRFNRVLLTVPSFAYQRTSGLLGTWDGNKANDIHLRNGTSLNICGDIADLNTFLLFSESWRISPSESLFDYPANFSAFNTSFVPSFGPQFANQQQQDEAEQLCSVLPPDVRSGCLYDLSFLNDTKVINSTQNTFNSLSVLSQVPRDLTWAHDEFLTLLFKAPLLDSSFLYDIEILQDGAWSSISLAQNTTSYKFASLSASANVTARVRAYVISFNLYTPWAFSTFVGVFPTSPPPSSSIVISTPPQFSSVASSAQSGDSMVTTVLPTTTNAPTNAAPTDAPTTTTSSSTNLGFGVFAGLFIGVIGAFLMSG